MSPPDRADNRLGQNDLISSFHSWIRPGRSMSDSSSRFSAVTLSRQRTIGRSSMWPGNASSRQCASSRLRELREEASQWKFAKPSDDFHHNASLYLVRVYAVDALALSCGPPLYACGSRHVTLPLVEASAWRGQATASCVLSLLNVPSRTQTVKHTNGHPQYGVQVRRRVITLKKHCSS